jgi:pSer/pThr/pTyr-binding forkhead associated (FHA) protein
MNRPQSAFCQDCGKPLAAEPSQAPPAQPARMRPLTPVAGVPIGATCPTCRTVNAPGMQFCKMCGTKLVAPAPPPAAAAAPPSAPSPVPFQGSSTQAFTCASCRRPTPAGYVFCQNCGARLEPAPPATAPGVQSLGAAKAALVLSTLPGTPHPRPSAPMPQPAPAPAPVALAGSDPLAVTFRTDVATATAGAAWGALVRMHVDGRDGERSSMTDAEVSLGREQGQLVFADDRYLAPRHAVVERHVGGARLRVLDEVNGVYVRLRESHLLVDGDHFLVGQQVFRFDLPAGSEASAAPLVQHGICLFGTPSRPAWGRLRQLTTSGHVRDVIHLTRPEIVLGREAGDHCFGDDEFMSRRHAALTGNGGRPTLNDLGSSNGTYVRVRGELILRTGDVFRLGDQLLRFEQA